MLSELPKLEVLQLGGNLIKRIEEDSFPVYQLKSLDLSSSFNLETIKGNAFRGASNLETLIISHSPLLVLTEDDTFNGLANLQVLDLSFNKMLQYLNPEMFTPLSSLVKLSLKSSSLSMIEPRIGSLLLPNLRFLDVRDNPLICNCSLAWIRKHFLSTVNDSSSLFGYNEKTSEDNNNDFSSSTKDVLAVQSTQQMLLRQLWQESLCFDSPSSSFSIASHFPLSSSSPSSYSFFEEGQRGKRIIDLMPEVTSCEPKGDSTISTLIVFVLVTLVVSVVVSLFLARKGLSKCLFRIKGRHVKSGREHHRNPVVDHLSHASFLPSSLTSVSATKLNPQPVSSSSMLHVGNKKRKIYGFDPVLSMTTSRHLLHQQQQHQQLLATTLARNNSSHPSVYGQEEHFSGQTTPDFFYLHNGMNSTRGFAQTEGRTSVTGNNRSVSNLSNVIRRDSDEGSGGISGGTSFPDHHAIYRSRHVVNNLNNPYEQPAYEVVPIVPPSIFASSAAATLAASRGNNARQLFQHQPSSHSSGSSSSGASTSSSQIRSWQHHQQQHQQQQQQQLNRQLPQIPQHHLHHPSLFQEQHILDLDDPMFNIYEEADSHVTSSGTPSTEL